MTTLRPQPLPEQRDEQGTVVLPRVDVITNLPILILSPHSRCNCRCLMCDIWRNTTRDEISVDVLATHVAEWRSMGVRRVVLTGGEALMHSRIWELCDVLRAADIGITILTTSKGVLSDREVCKQKLGGEVLCTVK